MVLERLLRRRRPAFSAEPAAQPADDEDTRLLLSEFRPERVPDAIVRVPRLTLAYLVMDASTSMKSFGGAAEEAMRGVITDLQSGPRPECIALGIMSFADDARILLPIQMIGNVSPFCLNYASTINGRTRLYATVAEALATIKAVDDIREIGDRVNIVFTVFTDGNDNLSAGWLPTCRQLADHGFRRGWQLSVTGFGVDGESIAAQMGFRGQNGQPAGETIGADRQSLRTSMAGFSKRTHMTVSGTPVGGTLDGVVRTNA